MSNYAVISEFNPFHNGHKYLFEQARELGAERIICIMSANSVQRGEIALADKYARAQMAIECGADLVLELPFPFCSAGAEQFASCGVEIASLFADKLIFGSESADIELLTKAAKICSSADFVKRYKASTRENSGAAESYFRLLGAELGGYELCSNDILGVEYIKAIIKQGSPLFPITIKRRGADYSSRELCAGELQSASAIRELVYDRRYGELEKYMPRSCADILMRELSCGRLTDKDKLEGAMRLFFGMKQPAELEGIAEVDEGIASRLCKMAREAADVTLLESVRTKRYTDARLRRAMLFSLCGVSVSDVRSSPAYVNLLAANSRGRELLAEKKERAIEVLAKPTDIPNTPEARRQFELSCRCDLLFALSCEKPCAASEIIARSPIIR